MPDYRCYFRDENDHIKAVEVLVDCPGDGEAGRIAVTMLAERPMYDAVEVWDKSRKVSRHVRA
jgi:hypothetical protein